MKRVLGYALLEQADLAQLSDRELRVLLYTYTAVLGAAGGVMLGGVL